MQTINETAEKMLEAGMTLDQAEKMIRAAVITAAMLQTGGNQCKSAELLGVHRNTLGRALDECNLPSKRHHWRKPAMRAHVAEMQRTA